LLSWLERSNQALGRGDQDMSRDMSIRDMSKETGRERLARYSLAGPENQ
jgi:hypothetical protein